MFSERSPKVIDVWKHQNSRLNRVCVLLIETVKCLSVGAVVVLKILRLHGMVEQLLGLTKQQALKTMMTKKDFERMLEIRSRPTPSSRAPRPITCHAGNIDDDDKH